MYFFSQVFPEFFLMNTFVCLFLFMYECWYLCTYQTTTKNVCNLFEQQIKEKCREKKTHSHTQWMESNKIYNKARCNTVKIQFIEIENYLSDIKKKKRKRWKKKLIRYTSCSVEEVCIYFLFRVKKRPFGQIRWEWWALPPPARLRIRFGASGYRVSLCTLHGKKDC